MIRKKNIIKISNKRVDFYMRDFAIYHGIKYTYSSPIFEDLTYIQFINKKERDKYLKESKITFKTNKEIFKEIMRLNKGM